MKNSLILILFLSFSSACSQAKVQELKVGDCVRRKAHAGLSLTYAPIYKVVEVGAYSIVYERFWSSQETFPGEIQNKDSVQREYLIVPCPKS